MNDNVKEKLKNDYQTGNSTFLATLEKAHDYEVLELTKEQLKLIKLAQSFNALDYEDFDVLETQYNDLFNYIIKKLNLQFIYED